ncbi:MAG: flavodoxin family protein [Spirochaetes bacterium]|nr:flavodoxin family protein [Spirochaetota bacterium]
MKVIGVSCSPRKGKSTYFMLNECLKALNGTYKNINTELIELSELKINGCKGCGHCRDKLDCNIKDDFIKLIPKLNDKDLRGLIIATPVYMGSATSQCKAFLDRTVMFRRNGFLLRNKVGAGLTVGGSRNGGQEIAIQVIHAGLLINDFIIVSDGPGNAHFGGTLWNNNNSYENDDYGLITVRNLGKRVGEFVNNFLK